jgi:hypothetical protein
MGSKPGVRHGDTDISVTKTTFYDYVRQPDFV